MFSWVKNLFNWDPPLKIEVEVTQEDIEKGMRSSATSCPIALAFRRKVGVRTAVSAYSTRVYGRKTFLYETPRDAARFIANYDMQIEPVHPQKFTFQLEREY